ncbi:hypothetical protein QYE76_038794 [Lolium multiflorum]|uniref:Reverse transcriptase domain-containing protein n=1 Tax=Lolium multiflorum TaxID=4521 RepID=A0AAD8T8Q1_LOLMU|nr:hypothetical protein QYE76_038794 [Lolium multiflorum]
MEASSMWWTVGVRGDRSFNLPAAAAAGCSTIGGSSGLVKELGAAGGLGDGVEAQGQWKGVVVSAFPAAEVVPWPAQKEELDRGGRRGCGGGWQELDKAPGPDGFTGRFYVACWEIIKDDVMDAFQAMWSGDCRGLHLANQTLISLLPKHADAMEVKDFRPISMIHSVAKLIAKVLSSRLAPRMGQIIGSYQSAFIRGRCLHDNFQLEQSTARRLNALKAPAIMLKLDITKAFDTVD